MKIKKYIIALICLVIVYATITICLPKKYRIPQKVLFELEYEAKDFVETYETNNYDYTKVYEDDNGDLVLVLTNKQKQKFKEKMLSQLEYAEYSYKRNGVRLK